MTAPRSAWGRRGVRTALDLSLLRRSLTVFAALRPPPLGAPTTCRRVSGSSNVIRLSGRRWEQTSGGCRR